MYEVLWFAFKRGSFYCTASTEKKTRQQTTSPHTDLHSSHSKPSNCSAPGPSYPTSFSSPIVYLITRMRLSFGAVAVLGAFQCISIGLAADLPFPADIALKKAVGTAVATPLQEALKDLYAYLVHDKGSRAVRRFRYSLAGVKHGDVLKLSQFIMGKIRTEIFDGRVNEKTWDMLTMELYFALLDWWMKTPEHPKDAADIGVWHALVGLYKDVVAPALRGSSRIASFNELLLDPELADVKKWVGQWKGTPPPQIPHEKPMIEEANDGSR
ncbi:dense-granule antigen [Cyclospora cayetanensis]|uniref:Dense-granule antigen n=1 Tax=Cyclospora cayetanensis TaxID=88456 RepID=A0A1D3D6M0_9EIME|nr:dense-granule antigen [Cyclospora cayetanensis]